MDVYLRLHAKLRKLGLKNKIDYELREGGGYISIETRDKPKIITLLASIGIPAEYETVTLPWGTFTSLVVKQDKLYAVLSNQRATENGRIALMNIGVVKTKTKKKT